MDNTQGPTGTGPWPSLFIVCVLSQVQGMVALRQLSAGEKVSSSFCVSLQSNKQL